MITYVKQLFRDTCLTRFQPDPPPFLIKAVQEMEEYSPQLDIFPVMLPYFLGHVRELSLRCSAEDWDASSKSEIYMLPCIRCNHCQSNYIVLIPETICQDFERYHANIASHGKNLRTSLMPNSSTVKKAIRLVTNGDPEESRTFVNRLADGDLFVLSRLAERYRLDSGAHILALALDENEIDVAACLLDQCEGIRWTLERRWTFTIGNTRTAKMLISRGLDDMVLHYSGTGPTLIDCLVLQGKTAEAVSLVQFAADRKGDVALGLACDCDQETIIAFMLQMGANPNQTHRRNGAVRHSPLERALMLAKAKAVFMLLEAGAQTASISPTIRWSLELSSLDSPQERPLWCYPDAREKIALLCQYELGQGK